VIVGVDQRRKRQQSIGLRPCAGSIDAISPPSIAIVLRVCQRPGGPMTCAQECAGRRVHHGAIEGGTRSTLAGRKSGRKCRQQWARAQFEDAAIVEIADVSRLSLTSPMPRSRASSVSIRVL